MQRIRSFYNENFVYKRKSKLSKLAILFILVLNLFIFITMYIGIDFYTKILNTPISYFPRQCQNILLSNNVYDFNNYFYRYTTSSIDKHKIDYRCNDIIYKKLKNVRENININVLIKKDSIFDKKYTFIKTKIKDLYYKHGKLILSEYDVLIYENNTLSLNYELKEINDIKLEHDFYKKELLSIKKEKRNLYESFKDSTEMVELRKYIKNNKSDIIQDYNNLLSKYELKKELTGIAFKIPPLIIVFFMMKKYLRRRNYILFCMFKSVFYSMSIPIVISILVFFYMLIPENLFTNFIIMLNEIEMHFLVYYFAIAIFLLTFGFLIEKLQLRQSRKLKNCKSNNISKVVLNKCTKKK